MQEEVAAIQRSNVRNKYLLPLIIAGGLLLLSLIFNITLFIDNQQMDNKQVAAELADMNKQLPASEIPEQTTVHKLEKRHADIKNTAVQFFKLVNNKKLAVPYNELALGDHRMKAVDTLVKRALNSGYTGKIILQTHIGKFCMNSDLAGNYTLADDKSPVTQCQYMGNYRQPTDTPTTHQSLSFANYLSDSGPLIIRGIIIEVGE